MERYFVCGLGLGFSACVTLESQRIRRLQGQLLYGLAALKAMWRRWSYLDLTGTIDGEPLSANPTLLISLLLGRREGGFVMAPDARLDDGWFDCVHAGNLTRWEALRLIPGVSSTGPPHDHPKLHLRRCRHMVIESAQDLVIHTDGEILCRPEDRVRRVEVELLPGRLLVRCGLQTGSRVDFCHSEPWGGVCKYTYAQTPTALGLPRNQSPGTFSNNFDADIELSGSSERLVSGTIDERQRERHAWAKAKPTRFKRSCW